ncbi:hypothetical protein CASFOL_041218 [Castilleja foliolosa]|uniref:F-box domain-containing protein n=1 Tax=Castilleja foliolosa TaxID=1961234 RepID=A0ABD3BFI3_9LAMI
MSIPIESIADAAMADCILPTDIMLSILTRLPAKSIQRCKFVSKLWCELFCNPMFIKMYKGQFSLDPNNQSAIIFDIRERVMSLINIDSNDSPKKPSNLFIPLSDRPGHMFLIGCCNGMICMIHHVEDIVYLWNPAMEMYSSIELSEVGGRYIYDNRDDILCDTHRRVSYVDGEEYFVSLGLGYDDEEDDFLLVRIVGLFVYGYLTTSFDLAEVYSLNSNAWITVGADFSFGVEKGSVVTVNGNPYWVAHTNDVEAERGDEEDALVYFDVKLLAFKIMSLPPPYLWSMHTSFVDLNGTLGYLECAPNIGNTDSCAKVWVFEDSWICKHTIGPINRTFDFDSYVMSFVLCSRNENILGCYNDKCFVYDRQSNCVEDILTLEKHIRFKICGYTPNFEPRMLTAR